MSSDNLTAEIVQLTGGQKRTLAAGLQRHDPEPYFPGGWEDKAYYREYAAAVSPVVERIIAAHISGAVAALREGLADDSLEATGVMERALDALGVVTPSGQD